MSIVINYLKKTLSNVCGLSIKNDRIDIPCWIKIEEYLHIFQRGFGNQETRRWKKLKEILIFFHGEIILIFFPGLDMKWDWRWGETPSESCFFLLIFFFYFFTPRFMPFHCDSPKYAMNLPNNNHNYFLSDCLTFRLWTTHSLATTIQKYFCNNAKTYQEKRRRRRCRGRR